MYFISAVLVLSVVLSIESTGDEQDFFQFTLKDIHGADYQLEQHRGSVILVVNVASECGFTDGHYKGLVKLQNILAPSEKFTVLGFPCNQFGAQEPENNGGILKFARDRYQVNFPLLSKINVIGENADPVYRYLKDQSGEAPSWNFGKYLINHEGKVLHFWGPWTDIEEVTPYVKQAVDEALKARGPFRPGSDANTANDTDHEPYMEGGMTQEERSNGHRDARASGEGKKMDSGGAKAPALKEVKPPLSKPLSQPGTAEHGANGPSTGPRAPSSSAKNTRGAGLPSGPPPRMRGGKEPGPPPPPTRPSHNNIRKPKPPATAPKSPTKEEL